MSRKQSARASLRAFTIVVFVAGAACGHSEPESSTNPSDLTVGSCNKTPIDRLGTLPACAAGSASRTRPGVPDDYSGPANGSLLLSASELAAQAIAAQIAAARHPAGVDPVELGYPPIPAAARTATGGGSQ